MAQKGGIFDTEQSDELIMRLSLSDVISEGISVERGEKYLNWLYKWQKMGRNHFEFFYSLNKFYTQQLGDELSVELFFHEINPSYQKPKIIKPQPRFKKEKQVYDPRIAVARNINFDPTKKTGQILKPVFQYDPRHTPFLFIREFKSITDAAINTNINRSNIGRCCSGRLKSAGWWFWSFTKL